MEESSSSLSVVNRSKEQVCTARRRSMLNDTRRYARMNEANRVERSNGAKKMPRARSPIARRSSFTLECANRGTCFAETGWSAGQSKAHTEGTDCAPLCLSLFTRAPRFHACVLRAGNPRRLVCLKPGNESCLARGSRENWAKFRGGVSANGAAIEGLGRTPRFQRRSVFAS